MKTPDERAIQDAIDNAEEITDPLDGLVERAKLNPGEVLKLEVLSALCELEREDPPAFEDLRVSLKENTSVRVTKLDIAMAKESRSNGSRSRKQSDIRIGLVENAADLPHTADEENDGTEDPSGSQAKQLVEHARSENLELFYNQREDGFAAIDEKNGRRIVAIGSKDFSLWLRRLAWKQMHIAPGGEVITTARHTLESIARFEGERHELSVRCARNSDGIWIDLDGASAVRVSGGSWQVEQRPPILFRRFSHQRATPHPQRGGKIERVLDFLRIKELKTRLLFLCYLVIALVPDIPVAALIVHGHQGATKTTLLKILKRLLDPSAVEVRGSVKDLTEFAQAAAQNRVLFFDNLTSVPNWLSDALCRTVTGEGWSKRSLFTDEDSTVFEYRAVVGLGGINLVADRPDLLDRSVIIPLERVPDEERRPEEEFWSEFEEARPMLLGGILDVLAKAAEIRPGLVLPKLPRMADFAHWGAAAAVAMGYKAEDFLEAYAENVARQNDAAIDASPVAQTVLLLMERCTSWSGAPGELLARLESVADDHNIKTSGRDWPKNASWVTRRLHDVHPNLIALGVRVTDCRTGQKRNITIEKTSPAPPDVPTRDSTMTRSGNAVTDAVISNPLRHNGHDSNDTSDTISATPWGQGEIDANCGESKVTEERESVRDHEPDGFGEEKGNHSHEQSDAPDQDSAFDVGF